jgi:hypothetical protein
MRIAGLLGLAAVILAIILAVSPKATVLTNDVSAEVYGIDFTASPQSSEKQTAQAR